MIRNTLIYTLLCCFILLVHANPLQGQGEPAFSSNPRYVILDSIESIDTLSLADLNNNTFLDLVVSEKNKSKLFTFKDIDFNSTLPIPPDNNGININLPLRIAFSDFKVIDIADLNNDNFPEIITLEDGPGIQRILNFHENTSEENGPISFSGAREIIRQSNTNNTTLPTFDTGDITQDGFIDIVFSEKKQEITFQSFIYTLSNNKVMGFSPFSSFSTEPISKIQLNDLDQDQDLDLLVVLEGPDKQIIKFHEWDGYQFVEKDNSIELDIPMRIICRDINSDGLMDIVVFNVSFSMDGNYKPSARLYRQTEPFHFTLTAEKSLPTLDNSSRLFTPFEVYDFLNNNQYYIVTQSNTGLVTIKINEDSFGANIPVGGFEFARHVLTEDVNNDGYPDIVFSSALGPNYIGVLYQIKPEPTPTPLPTDTPAPTDTPVPTNTPVPTDTPVPPTATHTPTYTSTPVPPTATSTFTPIPTMTFTPTATITPTLSPTATHTPTPSPTATWTPLPSATPTPHPTATPRPFNLQYIRIDVPNVSLDMEDLAFVDMDADGDDELMVSSGTRDEVVLLDQTGPQVIQVEARHELKGRPLALVRWNEESSHAAGVSLIGNRKLIQLQYDYHVGFLERSSYDVPFAVNKVFFADYTSDGKQDMLALSLDGQALAIYPGDGAGKYGNMFEVATDTYASDAAVFDYDNNGRSEVILTSVLTNRVTISRILTGNALFPLSSRVVGELPVSLTYGHFDDDEYFDVVVSNQGNDTLTMLLTQGQPGLTLRQNLDVGRQPVHVLTADFNQDRKSDLMVAEEADQNVSILLGPDYQRHHFPVAMSPYKLATGDMNQDGRLDFAVIGARSSTVTFWISLPPVSVDDWRLH
ncbi:MAG: FG-GAP repeat domain-containing protein [bacterium]